MLLALYTQTMKSARNIGLRAPHRPRRKQSNTTTLASSSAERHMRARSFEDEPFPKDPTRRLLRHQLKAADFSDEEEVQSGVVVEEEENEGFELKRTIPHFIVMSDHGEFAERERMRAPVERRSFESRCRSVQLMRLPQVNEEKREEDEQHVARSKLPQFKDRNEFGQRTSLEGSPLIDLDSLEGHFTTFPERIPEAETEEYPRERAKYDKTTLSSELEKLKVDEIDQYRRSREEQQDIEEIIEEERQEEETESVKKLRLSLEKLEHEAEYLNKFKEEELRVSIHEEEEEDEEVEQQPQAISSNNDRDDHESNEKPQ